MKTKRPVNINVLQYRFPVPAIASILHRISGVVLFLAIPFALWLLQTSLQSPGDFEQVRHYIEMPVIKFFVWACLAALFYHLLAGIRHFMMDSGFAESFRGASMSACVVITVSTILAIMAGVWLW